MNIIKAHKTLVVATLAIVSAAIICSALLYNNQIYAQRVISAVEQNDIIALEQLLALPFGNLNCKPSLWLLEVLSEQNTATPLQVACKEGNPEIVELLLKNGAKANYTHWDQSRNQGSPLTNAAGSLSDQRLQVMKLLVAYGADVNYEDANGNDALSCAVYASLEREDTIEIIEYLEQHGVDIYKKYAGSKNTLLHKACECDSYVVIQYLVNQRGFDINSTNGDGDSPLIYFLRFASKRKKDTLMFLLQEGADPKIINHEGKTAYDYVTDRHPEFEQLIAQQMQ